MNYKKNQIHLGKITVKNEDNRLSKYAMADIHGCYNELMKRLEKIKFSSKDTLIIAGDYIDRGEQNIEMLNWVISAPENIILLKGNHDEEFISYVLNIITRRSNVHIMIQTVVQYT